MKFQKTFLGMLVLSSMLIFTSCGTAPKQEEKRDEAADMKAINTLRSQFIAAFNSNDPAAIAATYTDDAIVMPTNRTAVEGKQAIQTYYAARFKQNPAKIALKVLETRVMGDWAYDRGDSTITVAGKSGKPVEQSSKYLVIVKRQADGSWKIYRAIYSDNLPSTPAAPKKKARRHK
jgi:uncharacterized protein (TIGR02246 family)